MHTVDNNWHSDYIESCKKRSDDSLRYIMQDCRNAIEAMPENPKCSQYMDEIHYCAMELRRRKDILNRGKTND